MVGPASFPSPVPVGQWYVKSIEWWMDELDDLNAAIEVQEVHVGLSGCRHAARSIPSPLAVATDARRLAVAGAVSPSRAPSRRRGRRLAVAGAFEGGR